MISAFFSRIGGVLAAVLGALAVLAGAFFYGRKKGGDAERKNTDLVKAQADAEKARQWGADAKADADANQARLDAAAQRKRIDDTPAAPGEAQKDLLDNWSRD